MPPHALPSLAQAGRAPCGAALTNVVQVPTLPATSQAWHWPEQPVSQQTPSTQLLLAHWLAPPQALPSGCFGEHTPPEQ